MIPQINIVQSLNPIVVVGTNFMEKNTILPFSVVATSNGQTSFTLPYAYLNIICFFIMGTGQDPLIGDYTISGNVVTLGSTAPYINIGDIIFGSGQLI